MLEMVIMLSFQSDTIPSYEIRTIYIQTILQNYKEIGGGPCKNVDQEIAKTTVKDACLQPKPPQPDIPPTFEDTFGFDDLLNRQC